MYRVEVYLRVRRAVMVEGMRSVRQVFAWGGWGWFGERHFLPMTMRRQRWFAGGIR